MNNKEKQIVIKGFATELAKEAGMFNTAKNFAAAAVKGFKNPTKLTGTTGVADDVLDAATGKASDAFEVGQHVGRNKGAYGLAAGAVGGIGAVKALQEPKPRRY